jgi:hypothetical protein
MPQYETLSYMRLIATRIGETTMPHIVRENLILESFYGVILVLIVVWCLFYLFAIM